ncbi:sulfotransferase family protein [Vulcanococcus limneticus]|uniref:sulfotransferase family protein n=1 Tax=Vulcanococcus limneticus TaxID=2170428 RepID=UPI00398BC2E3
MRLPAFIGLGTQKGGTTSLQRLLADHPGLFLPPVKEVQFFSLHHGRGAEWYSRHYAGASPHQLCGDITPYYLFHPAVPERLQRALPQARLVVLLRDPVERALSGLFHSIRLGLEPLPPEQALAAEAGRLAGAEGQLLAGLAEHHSHQVHSYLSRSRYEQQLARYEALFPAEQLLILRSEDFFSDPEPLWRQLLAFLELDAVPLPAQLPVENAGQGEARGVDPALRQSLRQQLEPTYAAMAQRYGLGWP